MSRSMTPMRLFSSFVNLILSSCYKFERRIISSSKVPIANKSLDPAKDDIEYCVGNE